MNYYVITISGGDEVLINLAQISKIEKDGVVGIEFSAEDISSSVSYNFSSTPERDDVFAKLKKILDAKNLNSLPPQT